jgi:hypothetical protein
MTAWAGACAAAVDAGRRLVQIIRAQAVPFAAWNEFPTPQLVQPEEEDLWAPIT